MGGFVFILFTSSVFLYLHSIGSALSFLNAPKNFIIIINIIIKVRCSFFSYYYYYYYYYYCYYYYLIKHYSLLACWIYSDYRQLGASHLFTETINFFWLVHDWSKHVTSREISLFMKGQYWNVNLNIVTRFVMYVSCGI